MKYAIVVLTLVLFLTGCATRNGATPSQDVGQSGVRVRQTAPNKPQIIDKAGVSNRLEQLAMGVPQVKGANCVVIGNTAIVGIDVEPDLPPERVDVVKYSVAEALRKDPNGKYAIVTADMDLGERIRDIRTAALEGRPISGFAEELVDLVGRIMPQIPRDVSPRGPGENGPTGNEQAPLERQPVREAPSGAGAGGTQVPASNQSPGQRG